MTKDKVFIVADIHRLLKEVTTEKITFTRMVEIMNEMCKEHYAENLPIPDARLKEKDDLIKHLNHCIQEQKGSIEMLHALNEALGLTQWVAVAERLPEDEVRVLCYHHSGNYFICYRTKDCLTNEPKWFGGAMPDFWKPLPEPPCR